MTNSVWLKQMARGKTIGKRSFKFKFEGHEIYQQNGQKKKRVPQLMIKMTCLKSHVNA